MKAFHCTDCGHLIFFENVQCERCGSMLGFIPETGEMSAFVKLKGFVWETKPASGDGRYKPCYNYSVEKVCNWMVPENSTDAFCHSCRLTAVIPNLKAPRRRYYWSRLEAAKRRLLYTLAVLGLRVDTRKEHPDTGLEFEFLESRRGKKILTGHHSGLITMNIAEADEVRRERLRIAMREPYRTLLGHFRHEIGHYYFDRLIVGARRTGAFRSLFGDDRTDYSDALARHYRDGPTAAWATNHVSAYATMHPWEDWAETWAHYLHIVDTTGTARACGINIAQLSRNGPTFAAQVLPHSPSFDLLMKQWTMLTYAMNSLNRSMGMPDPYPFTLAPGAVKKLRFIHRLIEAQGIEHEHDRVEAISP